MGLFFHSITMQIESLKVFCDLVETGSFTLSAQMNGITQSAVSQQLSAFERHLDSTLVEGSRRRLRLTREGEVLYEYGKQIVESEKLLHSRMHKVAEIVSGTIRISAIYSIGLHDLAGYVKIFQNAVPAVDVQVEYRQAPQVYESVLDSVADLGFVAYPNRDPRLEIVHIRLDPLILICPPEHRLANLGKLKLKWIGGEAFVGFSRDIPTGKAVERILRTRNVNVRIVMEFDNIETIKRAVEIGAGIAIVPLGTVTQEVSTGTLVALPLQGDEFIRPIAAIYQREKVLSPALKQLISIVKGRI